MLARSLLVLAATWSLAELSSALVACATSTNFDPVSKDLSFRATYRVQALADGQPKYIGEIYERYTATAPAAASVWQLRHDWDGEQVHEKELRQFLYNAKRDRIIEIDRSANKGLRLNHAVDLFENGASMSYGTNTTLNEVDSIALLPTSTPLDSIVFSVADNNDSSAAAALWQQLNLDDYLSAECLIESRQNLRHIIGPSRLLHLLECRRREFKPVLDRRAQKQQTRTRGRPSTSYTADELNKTKDPSKPSSGTNPLDYTLSSVTVTYPTDDLDASSKFRMDSGGLPSRLVPISLSFYYAPKSNDLSGVAKWFFIVNIFQFEPLVQSRYAAQSNCNLDDHPISSHSIYTIPPAHGIDDLFPLAIRRKEDFRSNIKSFSFRAELTGTHLPYKDPLELLVVYDANRRVLARQTSQTDRSFLEGSSYARHVTRTVYDQQSSRKFHLMDSNYQYQMGAERVEQQSDDDAYINRWIVCATDELNHGEISRLERGAHIGLNLATSGSYLGKALVRGLECDVYEKRLYNIPEWLGLGASEFGHFDEMVGGKIFATLYVASTGVPTGSSSERLLRLELNVVTDRKTKVNEFGALIVMQYRVEIYGFQWTSEGFATAFGIDLLDVCQSQCLSSQQRQLEMDILFEPTAPLKGYNLDEDQRLTRRSSQEESYTDRLQYDSEFRSSLVAEALFKSYDIAPIQQVGLESEWIKSANESADLRVTLSVAELPIGKVSTQFIGYARDLSVGSSSTGGDTSSSWSVGVTSVSEQDCVWRAVHTLEQPNAMSSDYDYGRRDDDPNSSKLIMYCPRTLHCVLGDSKWMPILSLRPIEIKGVLKFNEPVHSDHRCSIISVSVRALLNTADKIYARKGNRRSQLDWLRAEQELWRDKTIELRQVNGPQLVELRPTKLRVSKIYNDNGDNENARLPLQGFAYESGTSGTTTVGETSGINPYEPLIAKQLATCEQTCLMHHSCRSFSACHHSSVTLALNDNDRARGKLVCVLSSLNWTDPAKLDELAKGDSGVKTFGQRSSARLSGSSSSSSFEIEVWPSSEADEEFVDEGSRRAPVKIRLLRSPLCTLYARSHLNAYRAAGSELIFLATPSTMLYAPDLDQCARLCLARAHLMTVVSRRLASEKQLETHTNEYLDALRQRRQSCLSFKFSSSTGHCYLLPELDYTEQENLLESARTPLELEWIEARKQVRLIGTKYRFGASDNYELDFAQLYVAFEQQTRIKITDSPHERVPKLQRSLAQPMSFNECARRCSLIKGCRSFDLRLDARAASRSECVLNAVAALDLQRATAAGGSALNRWAKLVSEEATDLPDDSSGATTTTTTTGEVDSGTSPATAEAAPTASSYWRHYEPSEMMLYAVSDPSERCNNYRTCEHTNAAAAAVPQTGAVSRASGIYIDPNSVARDCWRLQLDDDDDRQGDQSFDSRPMALAQFVAVATVLGVLFVGLVLARAISLLDVTCGNNLRVDRLVRRQVARARNARNSSISDELL